MENNTVLWITIAAYIICLVVIGIVEGRKAKSIADLTVGGRNITSELHIERKGEEFND